MKNVIFWTFHNMDVGFKCSIISIFCAISCPNLSIFPHHVMSPSPFFFTPFLSNFVLYIYIYFFSRLALLFHSFQLCYRYKKFTHFLSWKLLISFGHTTLRKRKMYDNFYEIFLKLVLLFFFSTSKWGGCEMVGWFLVFSLSFSPPIT